MQNRQSSCPSCQSSSVKSTTSISSSEIIALYKKHGILVESQFSSIPVVDLLKCDACSLRYFYPAVAGNEDFYNQLQEHEWYFMHEDKSEFTYSLKFITDDAKVLDVGSGRGAWAKYITKPGVFYQGIEYSSKSIQLAKSDGTNVIKESISDHASKYPTTYDIVVAFQVLEHVENISEFITECTRALKPGGKLIIAVPNNDGFLKNLVNNWLNMPPHHINHWNETSLRTLGQQHSLKTIEIYKENVTPIHKLLFYNVRMLSKIYSSLGLKQHLIDWSFRYKILNKLAMQIAKRKMQTSIEHKTSVGHTIVIVYEKLI